MEYIYPGQNKKNGYFLKRDHSIEYEMIKKKKVKILDLEKKQNKKELFILICENIMNKSNIYDRNLFKNTFKNLYNDKNNDYDFLLNDNLLSNIISKWKNNSIRFTKSVALKEIKDYDNNLFWENIEIYL